MAKQEWKGSALLAPVPTALVTSSDGEHDNIFTVAWTGIINTQPPKLYISVRPSRYSAKLIQKSREFAVHPVTEALCRAADGCGVYTGAKTDKFEKYHLVKEKANKISSPILASAPLALECRVTDIIPLGTHEMYLADILAVDVDEALLDRDGKLHLERAKLITYAHGDYYALGSRIGSFGFAVRKKPNPKKSKG